MSIGAYPFEVWGYIVPCVMVGLSIALVSLALITKDPKLLPLLRVRSLVLDSAIYAMLIIATVLSSYAAFVPAKVTLGTLDITLHKPLVGTQLLTMRVMTIEFLALAVLFFFLYGGHIYHRSRLQRAIGFMRHLVGRSAFCSSI
jgi:hypothetical protein